jgi:isoquinoline 1-oxidoreductase subunit beta
MTLHDRNISRRSVLTGGGALAIAFHLPRLARAQAGAALDAPAMPNAFLRIGADNTVTVICKHVEMGQGPYTGLTTIVAEELDADWSQMRAESAPVNANLLFRELLCGGRAVAIGPHVQS